MRPFGYAPLHRRAFVAVCLVAFVSALLSAPLARAEPALQQTQTPTTLVTQGVDSFTLNSERLTWLTNARCADALPRIAAGPELSAPSDPTLISRMPSYGGFSRTIFRQDDLGGPNLCNPYTVRSNIVADNAHIYWVFGNQLYRIAVNANPGDTPEPWGTATIFGSAPVELVIAGDLVIALTQFTDAIAAIRFIARADGATSGGGISASQARRLGYDGRYYYYLTSTELRRALPGEQTFTAIAGSITVDQYTFAPNNYAVVEQPGGGNLLYYARGNVAGPGDPTVVTQVFIYNGFFGTSSRSVYTTQRALDNLLGIDQRLFTLETRRYCSQPGPSCIADRYQRALVRTSITFTFGEGYRGGVPEELYSFDAALGIQSYITSDSLVSDGTFIYWREGAAFIRPGIKRLPNNAAGLPLVNVRATGMEVTQGIQSLDNRVFLIQNRRTFVRVYVQSDGASVNGVTAQLVGTWNNGTVNGGVLIPVNSVGPRITVQRTPFRNSLDDAFLFELPWEWTTKSDLQLRAVVNPFGVPIETRIADNEIRSGPFAFQPSPRLEVRFIRWSYTIGNNTYRPRLNEDIVQTYSWIRRTYPLASTPGFASDSSPGFRPNLWSIHDDTLGARVNRTNRECTDNSCAAAYSNSRLRAIRSEEGIPNSIFLYGMISDGAGWFPRGMESGGNASTGPAGRPGATFANETALAAPGSWDKDSTYADWYAGHEIGHSLGRPHPASGSDDPNTTTIENCGHSRSGSLAEEHGSLTSARAPIGPADNSVAGFDSGDPEFSLGRAVLPSATWNDMMSYCSNQWIADYTYTAIYNKLMAAPAQVANLNVRPAQVAGDWLSVFGSIAGDTLSADIHHLRRRSSVANVPPRTPGAYSIRLLNAAGAQVADYPFTPDSDEDNPSLSFGQIVPFAAGTREVRIVRLSDGRILASRSVSAGAPTVTNVRLENAPNPVAGTVTLAWNASDPDGDPLTADIFYSRANGPFQPLLLSVSGSSAEIDTAPLGGGSAILRVVVSDGVQSAQADTPPFTMANKAPLPRITNPADGTRMQWGQLLNLSGEAEDFQDGGVSGANLVWRNQFGILGTGPLVSVSTLPAGPNVITLTATNSMGVAASTSITVFVDDDLQLPGPTPAVGPTQVGWSVSPGATAPLSATVQISNSGGGSLTWTASEDATWLTLSATEGSAPAELTLTADPSGIPGGTTEATTVTLTFTDANGVELGIFELPVSISVGDAFNGNQSDPDSSPPPKRTVYLPLIRR